MPIYDYLCSNIECRLNGLVIERLVAVSKRDSQCCGSCGSTLQKMITAPEIEKVPHVSWSSWRIGIG